MNEPQRLGSALSAALNTGPSRATLLSQRDAVIAAMQASVPKAAPIATRRLTLACAGLALAAGVVLWLYVRRPPMHASYQGRELAEQARVFGTAPEGEALEFSDGSRLVLNYRAEISVSRLSRERAQVQLNRGTLSARIQKGTGRAWVIEAGPYSVRVVGTEFTIDWNSEQKEIGVNVSEGQVLVVGGDLPATGVTLSAGGRLVRRGPAEGRSPDVVAPSPQSTEVPPAKDETAAGAAAPTLPEPSWRSAAQAGNHTEGLRGAERLGFEHLVKSLPEKDLLLLANTARYAGSLGRARQALLGLRARFAKKPSAAVAALLLAGLAEDRDKNPAEAATWLRTFLRESPQGELSASARARLLAILLRQGNQSEAASIAADYLRYHPQGPYASKARDVLGSSAPR
jgi:hypothetical protein